jgi:hypothetical protein
MSPINAKEGFGAVGNVTLGNDANVIRSYGSIVSTSKVDLAQAYAQWAAPGVPLAGAEVIASASNPNFSRSILFGFAIPYTHTGGPCNLHPERHSYALSGGQQRLG